MRAFFVAGVMSFVVGLAVLATPGDAAACGGCFHEPPDPMQTVSTVVTDHRMAFTVSKTSTTLYDQIRYMGDPSKFAWVLPISGSVEVGLSADVMFASLDALTQTVLTAPALPPCPPPPSCYCPNGYRSNGLNCSSASSNAPTDSYGGGASDAGFGGADAASKDPGVVVTKREVVGPYEAVQLKATDPMSISAWLIANGFEIPVDVKPIIEAYQAEGFGFLALKLLPGQGVDSMRPVRVTTPGAGLGLPLRMVSAGTGANVGITLWVIGEGRYEPVDFPFFRIADDELVWDWSSRSSNYAQLRQKKTQDSKGFAWEMESSTDVGYLTLEQLVMSGGNQRGGFIPATIDYSAVVDPQTQKELKPADLVRQEDLAAIFAGLSSARVTRMRADLVRAALGKDLHLGASDDQSQLPNRRSIQQAINVPPCPTYPPCPPCSSEGLGGGGGCSAASDGASDVGLLIGAGFVGLSWSRRRKKK